MDHPAHQLSQGWIRAQTALHFLGWVERIERERRRGIDALIRGSGAEGTSAGFPVPLTTVQTSQHALVDHGLCNHLRSTFGELLPGLFHRPVHLEDASAFADTLFDGHHHGTGIAYWLRLILSQLRIAVAFEGTEPVVTLDSLRGWLVAIEKIDPDSLAAFAIWSAHSTNDSISDDARWSTTLRITDLDFSRFVRQGLTDLHVHLGAGRSATARWQSLLCGDIRPQQLRWFSTSHRDAFWHDLVADVIEAFLCHEDASRPRLRAGSLLLCPLLRLLPPRPNDEPRKLSGNLARERRMLIRAFSELARDDANAERHRLETSLDLYIAAKSRCFRELRQSINSDPGLASFRRYFAKGKVRWHARDRGGDQVSPRSEMREYSDWLNFICQSASLRTVELRMAPLARPEHYHRFFSLWERIEKSLGFAGRSVDARFAIHFKRSLDGYQSKARARGKLPLHLFLEELDQDSAALQEFRFRQARLGGATATRISRIDLAGQERDLTPDYAVFCMNLLRGKLDALRTLRQPSVDRQLHRRWVFLSNQQRVSPISLWPALGVTCHAGEDFAHPLDGLFAMHSASIGLNLGSGDTIGHGIAAGWDIDRFSSERFSFVLTQRGTQFDAMLWLYLQIKEFSAGEFVGLQVDLEKRLSEEFSSIYAEIPWPLSSDAFADVWRTRWNAIPSKYHLPRATNLGATMIWHEIWNPACAASRAERVPLDPILLRLAPAISWFQQHVLKYLNDHGIALEFNPSSNWRVAQAEDPSTLPFMRILTQFKNLVLATINTDNPGIFETRIENEYAIVLEGLRDLGLSRAGAMDILERLRTIGIRLT